MENNIREYVNGSELEIETICKNAQDAGFQVYVEPNENFPTCFESNIPSLLSLCEKFNIKDISSLIRFVRESVGDSGQYFKEVYRCCIGSSIRWESTIVFHIELLLIRKYHDALSIEDLTKIGWERKPAECVLKKVNKSMQPNANASVD